MSWHVPSDMLTRYARGETDVAEAFSIEAHLPSCPHCRVEIAALVNGTRLASAWEGIEERLDAPRRGPVEAGLVRVGVPEHVARLLGATPALRLSWLLACALVLAFGVWAAGYREAGLVWFLMLAPLLPLAGVAAAYGPDVDPTYEIGLAAPRGGFGLLLIRALAVVTSTVTMAAVAAIALPGLRWTAAAWLAPSLALTLASLALSTRVAAPAACGLLAAMWVLAVFGGWRLADEPLLVFGAEGQLACAMLAAVAAVVLVRHAETFERRGAIR